MRGLREKGLEAMKRWKGSKVKPVRKSLMPKPSSWRSAKRRARRDLMAQWVAETGKPNTGRQWNRVKRLLRREEGGEL